MDERINFSICFCKTCVMYIKHRKYEFLPLYHTIPKMNLSFKNILIFIKILEENIEDDVHDFEARKQFLTQKY